MRILIVDDTPAIRQLIARLLAPLSNDIAECADGADALAAYEAHRPDVVLMDVAMRQLDGLTATGAITAAHPESRVVIVTNYDEADLREAARPSGACAYVLKVSLLELLPVLVGLGQHKTVT
jgi:CheY-like chemotaxis protein